MPITRSAPYFPVADVARSAAYYSDTLGFNTEYSAGVPPEFAMVSRDGFSIMLRRVPAPEKIAPSEVQGGTWDAFLWVDDLESLHREYVKNGATIVYGPLLQQSYGMNEFAVRDIDGHVLGFGQPAK